MFINYKMSFNRLNYDNDTYKHILRESIGPGDYLIGTPRVDCDGCFFPSPDIRMDGYGAGVCEKELIDVDSELMGITRKQTNCPANKFVPPSKEFCNMKMPNDCYGLTTEDTKLSNPPCTLRGTGWNRWEWLCQNPQDKALIPFDWNVNNRLVVKDNHRPCVPNPLDQRDSLPPMDNDRVVYDWSSRYNKPMYDVVSPQLGICQNIHSV
jgi:hypothetical protein